MGNTITGPCSTSNGCAAPCNSSKNDIDVRHSMKIASSKDLRSERIDEWSGKREHSHSKLMSYCTAGERDEHDHRPHNFVADIADGHSIIINNSGDSVVVDDDLQGPYNFGLSESEEVLGEVDESARQQKAAKARLKVGVPMRERQRPW